MPGLSFNRNVFFSFLICIGVLPVCLVSEQGVRFPGTGAADRCELPHGFWESQLGLLAEQPPRQPHLFPWHRACQAGATAGQETSGVCPFRPPHTGWWGQPPAGFSDMGLGTEFMSWGLSGWAMWRVSPTHPFLKQDLDQCPGLAQNILLPQLPCARITGVYHHTPLPSKEF